MKSGDHQFDPGREQYIFTGHFPFIKRSFYSLLVFGPDLSELHLAIDFVWVFSSSEITIFNLLSGRHCRVSILQATIAVL